MKAMYVQLDPSSVRAAEEREWREQKAASAVLSVTRISAEELRRQAFWQRVEARTAKALRNDPVERRRGLRCISRP